MRIPVPLMSCMLAVAAFLGTVCYLGFEVVTRMWPLQAAEAEAQAQARPEGSSLFEMTCEDVGAHLTRCRNLEVVCYANELSLQCFAKKDL